MQLFDFGMIIPLTHGHNAVKVVDPFIQTFLQHTFLEELMTYSSHDFNGLLLHLEMI